MKKLLRYPIVLLFALFILSVTAVDLVKPDKSFSEFENKVLEKKPIFSISNFISGDFGTGYVRYINDQFLGRNQWISLKAVSELCLGKLENNGILLGKDSNLFEKLQLVESKPATSGTNVVEKSKLERSTRMVKEFFLKYDIPVTFSLVPNSSEVLSEKLPGKFQRVDQQASTKAIYQEIQDDDVTLLNFYDSLRAHKDEYIYYRTDHHWTTLGAYYAYTDYCKAKGLTPVDLQTLSSSQVEGFYGTYFSKAKMPGIKADTITWYDIPPTNFAFHFNPKDKALEGKGEAVDVDGLSLLSVPSLYNTDQFATRDKYAALLWGNSGYSKIVSGHNLNHKEGKTSRLLLIKDSYANSMVPYLTYNYDEIIIIDLRSSPKKLSEILKEQFDDIFVMYNYSTFISDASNLANLRF